MTNKLQVTTADTGLPGKPKNTFLRPSNVSVAKVVGLLFVVAKRKVLHVISMNKPYM